MTRQIIPDPSTFDAKRREMYDKFSRGRKPRADGSFGGPFDPWLMNPGFFRQAAKLGVYLWEETSLDRGLVELAICITAREWQANVEWTSHAPRAAEHGIPQPVLDDVLAGRRPSGAAPEQALLYDICMSLHKDCRLPLDLYRNGVAEFGEQGVMEIGAVIGFYTMVSMTLNSFEVEVAPGVTPAFARDR